jgi:hypothetical protein
MGICSKHAEKINFFLIKESAFFICLLVDLHIVGITDVYWSLLFNVTDVPEIFMIIR